MQRVKGPVKKLKDFPQLFALCDEKFCGGGLYKLIGGCGRLGMSLHGIDLAGTKNEITELC